MRIWGTAACAAAMIVCNFSIALADEAPAAPPASEPSTKIELGTRVWYSTGTSEFDLLYLGSRVSALHYQDQQAVSGELFGRIDSVHLGIFVKAVAGLG